MAREATVEIPYVSFKTFLTALDTLRQGVPDPLDRSVFRNQSGSAQAMLLAAFRGLGAIDEDGHPQPILARLVNPDERKVALREAMDETYPEALALDPAASQKQFDDCFYAYGVKGETHKKAKSFFLQAAHMVGIQLSPHIAGPRAASGDDGAPSANGVVVKRRRVRKRIRDGGGDGGDGGTDFSAAPKGSSKTIQLRSGAGVVTLTVSIDPMELEDDERTFVFHLIDKLKKYERGENLVEPS